MGGFFGDVLGGVGNMYQGITGAKAGKKAKKDAYRNQTNYYADLDLSREVAARNKYDPTYESQLIGPYQRSESPAARAYLESMLTGDNAQAAASPWDDQRVAAQGRSNDRYGSYDDLLAAGGSHRSATPWDTKTPGKTDTSTLRMLADQDSGPSRGNTYDENFKRGRKSSW